MYTRTIALLISICALSMVSYAQTSGMNIVLMDGSVRNILQVDAKFQSPSDPGPVRVRIGKLPARTLAGCMASTDFSAAVKMNTRMYQASYDQTTGTARFSFGVEREMKESGEKGGTESSCHVVRWASSDGSVDGRDFLIWQRGNSPNAQMQDGSVRSISHSISNGTW